MCEIVDAGAVLDDGLATLPAAPGGGGGGGRPGMSMPRMASAGRMLPKMGRARGASGGAEAEPPSERSREAAAQAKRRRNSCPVADSSLGLSGAAGLNTATLAVAAMRMSPGAAPAEPQAMPDAAPLPPRSEFVGCGSRLRDGGGGDLNA